MVKHFSIIQQKQRIIQHQIQIIQQQQQETIRKSITPPQQSSDVQIKRLERQIIAVNKSLQCLRTQQTEDRKKLVNVIAEVTQMKLEDSIFS